MRNERYRKNAISVRERHNERKNEVYSNPDVLLEYSHNNVIFKACEAATYAQQFDRMVEEGVVSTRGLKPDAYIFDELVFDVNTDYFETHGGYEYAKQFYAEVYELAKEITGGEQYIISAVMHADERNRETSDRLGRNVFHYHLHVVYLPVVEKQIRWSKRCKDPALRGTVRETIMQVSHSKKWPMVPMTNEQGQPVLKKNGKPRLVSSYSLLQTEFFEHMRQAGFTDFERGVQGSDAEHLEVLEYKVQKDRQTVAELSDQTKQLQGKRKELISQVKNISCSIRDVADIEQRAKTKGVLEKRVELPVQDFQTLCKMAKASGKLQAENRSLRMQLQQSTVREQELRQRIRTPLAAGERIYSRWGYYNFLKNNSIQLIQPDACNCGGITEVKKISDMAHAYDVGIQVHCAGSPLTTNAALHLECTLPNFLIHEHHTCNRMDTSVGLTKYNLQPENGYFTVPDLPGIGNEFLQEAIDRATLYKVIE